jgi:UDP-glucose 4-epimerase
LLEMAEQFRHKRILITGANGFIGGYLAEALSSAGSQLFGLGIAGWVFPQNVHPFTGDLRDAPFVQRCVDEVHPDYVFHLAAFKERTPGLESFREAVEVNLIGSLNLCRALQRAGTAQGILAVGTAEEYGHNPVPFVEGMREAPVSAYSFSKLCVTNLCEILHRLYELPIVVLRPTLAYGPRQNVDMFLPALITALVHNRPFPITPGAQTRDYVYVTDIVEAMLCSVLTPAAFGQVLNVGSGESVTIAELALNIERILDRTGLVQIGAVEYRPREVMDYAVCTRKTSEVLGWTAKVPFQEGLQRTVEYYRNVAAAEQ